MSGRCAGGLGLAAGRWKGSGELVRKPRARWMIDGGFGCRQIRATVTGLQDHRMHQCIRIQQGGDNRVYECGDALATKKQKLDLQEDLQEGLLVMRRCRMA